ncbi:MAG: M20/M25/M40 family metallo-hydrolase [Clostridia bacterium]|nr:M20/M25/M40 family metallo-hydrolase [Clostridia bacterium]
MKSTESVAKYDSEVRLYTNYAIKNIKNICKECGPRPVGSDEEKKALDYMEKELKTSCDSVSRESFKCSDKAFMSWVPLGAVLLVLAAVFFTVGLPQVSVALAAVELFFILSEFIFYKPVLDIFFPKKESSNVIGVRKASGETKKRIVFSGHMDSAYEWTYTYHGGRPAVAGIIVTAVIAIVLHLAGGIYAIIANDGMVWTSDNLALKIIAVVSYVTVPVLGAAVVFVNYKRPVTGANDDLTGSLISAAVIKFMNANDIRFENTEVVAALVGGEEAGLRGSKAWAKAHADEIKAEKDVETIFVSLDTIREFDFMAIYDKDMTGVVKNDKRVASLIQTAAKNLGYDVPVKAIELGATDAAAVSQAGIPASAFTAMDPSPARYYHTRLDTQDNLDPKTIETGLKIALETSFLFDEQGI